MGTAQIITNYELRIIDYELQFDHENMIYSHNPGSYFSNGFLEEPLKQENLIQQKSFEFAVQVINIYKYLSAEKREFFFPGNF